MRHLIIALAALAFGCAAPEPPRYFSVDEAFSEGERQTILAAVDAWCEAAGWCPTEALWAERGRFELVDNLTDGRPEACPEGKECVVAGRNSGDVVRVARNRPLPEDFGNLFVVVAHEIGHFCTEHTDTGLMAAYQETGVEQVVDAVAVAAWHEGCP